MHDIQRKVKFVSEKGSYTYVDDFTYYAKLLIECDNYFLNGEKISEDNIEKYYECGEFSIESIENKDHFLFGLLECLASSDLADVIGDVTDGDNLKIIVSEG